MQNVLMFEQDKQNLENYLEIILKCDNNTLLSHYTGAVRTHETNDTNQEYFRVMINRFYVEILKRMDKKE